MKIGILTMHRVVNYGSALQAYALQRFLFAQGYDNELIDYRFAPRPSGAKDWLRYIMKGNFVKHRKFKHFWRDNYILSPRTYRDKAELTEDACKYDIYLTGSDQVWSPKHGGGELTFMFDFIKSPTAIKISYASSFSCSNVSEKTGKIYSELLAKYTAISVREENALSLVRQLTGKEVSWVCDPTLLLSAKAWKELSCKSRISLDKPYVLFYILTYAYDPYPEIEHIIRQIRGMYKGVLSVFLNGKMSDKLRSHSIVVDNISPYDFINLVENAELVVTTSFHGTAFAINFRKPFYSIIQSDLRLDDRMFSLLKQVGLESRAVKYDETFKPADMRYGIDTERKISDFIRYSQKTLLKSLNF